MLLAPRAYGLPCFAQAEPDQIRGHIDDQQRHRVPIGVVELQMPAHVPYSLTKLVLHRLRHAVDERLYP